MSNNRIVSKSSRKRMRQVTVGNRKAEYDKSRWMQDVLDIATKSYSLLPIAPTIDRIKISARYMPNLFGKYDKVNNKIILNPCMADLNEDLDTWIVPVFLHQLGHWTSNIGMMGRTDYYFSINSMYPEVLESEYMERICEEYVAEYCARLLCDALGVHRPMGDKLLVWLEDKLQLYFTRIVQNNHVYGTILNLQKCATIAYNFIVMYDSANEIPTKKIPTTIEVVGDSVGSDTCTVSVV